MKKIRKTISKFLFYSGIALIIKWVLFREYALGEEIMLNEKANILIDGQRSFRATIIGYKFFSQQNYVIYADLKFAKTTLYCDVSGRVIKKL